jgi:hypothetical protein
MRHGAGERAYPVGKKARYGYCLRTVIQAALKQQVPLPLPREIVHRYKQRGGTRKNAYCTLEKIRQEYSEEPGEELLLDLMDFVAGFCSTEPRIWDEILVN